MKFTVIIIFLLAFTAINCGKQSVFSLSKSSRTQIIAIQPLDDFDMSQIDSVINEVSKVYDRRVILLQPIKIPITFINREINKYSADSILILLSQFKNNNIVEVIGLTNHQIFTTKQNKHISYLDDKIFGMGYQPGNSCVVSDSRFSTSNQRVYNRRLRNVIIHEVGHNLGLPHCKDNKCIMSTENGRYENLDNGNNGYCEKCKERVIK